MAFALKGAGSATTANSVAANQASLVVTTATTAGAANDLAVLLYAVDNNGTIDGDESAVIGVTDSAGNFWQKAVEFTNAQGGIQAGTTCGIWYCNLQNALAIGATVTLSFSDVTARDASAASLTYFTKAAGFKATVEGTPGTLAADAAAAGSLDVATSNSFPCLRIRAIASESSTATALTKTAAFTAVLTQSLTSSGASATNQGIRGEYLISTATGQASNPTAGAGSVDHASVYVAFKETAFTVGDPPHNSDVVGSQVAQIARKAVVATVIAASAGAFLPPYPTVQVAQTPRGWHQALSLAVPTAKAARPSYDLVAAPAAVGSTALGVPVFAGGAPRARQVYYQSNFVAPYVAPAVVAPYTNFWLQPLSGAPKVARAIQGDAFVPYDPKLYVAGIPLTMGGDGALSSAPVYYQSRFETPYPVGVAPVAPVSTATAIPLDAGGAAPRARQTYYQSRFDAPYVAPVVVAAYTNFWLQPLSVAAPVARAVSDFGSVAWFRPAAASLEWQQPLSKPAGVAQAPVGYSFVPYNTAQIVVAPYTAYYQQPLSVAVAVAKAIQGDAFVPFDTVQFIPPVVTPPVETPPDALGGTTSMGGGGHCRKTWKKCLEEIRQLLADEQASLKAAKARHDADIDYAARAARIADIQAKAAALEADCAAESLAVASARIGRFIDKLARIEADYQAALLRQFEDDEDDVLTILLT